MSAADEERERRRLVAEMRTVPNSNGETFPRKAGMRSLLPSTWLSRGVRVEYVGANGRAQETSAVLLDWCGAGVLLDVAGGKTLLSWDRLVLCELQED